VAKVEDVLVGFGEAIVAAQSRILKSAKEAPSQLDGLQTSFSISETEVELKLVFDEQGGVTAIRPVSSGASRMQDINPGVLSTLKAKILVVPDEVQAATNKTPGKIRDDVLKRPDIRRLAGIFGDLAVTTSFVPSARRWIVDVVEPGGLMLRSLQIDD
jgi:hypothetical protein